MGDDEEGGGFAMAFASKLGAGAAKAGKKVAQSEAGRRATRAAIKGSMDAVRDDMVSRYSEPNTPTSPAPKDESTERKVSTDKKASVASGSGGVKENTVPSWMEDDSDEDEYVPYSYREASHQTHRKETPPSHSNPPKPSFFDKFKLSSGSSSSKPQPRPAPKDPKERVFKHRLAKKPDWDSLPMAQALHHYKAEMKCDLEFRKGQMIHVITRTDTQNDWWEGKIEGRVGIFPANYVKVLN